MKNINQIAIIGLGLIGGSFALAIKRQMPNTKIVAVDTNLNSIDYAIKNKIIDNGSRDYSIIKNSNLVVVCTPLNVLQSSIQKAHDVVKDTSIIVDFGSTKQHLADVAAGKRFIGAHPMAGTEHSGVENAKQDLFVDKYFLIVPFDNTTASNEDIETVKQLASLLQSKTHIFSPDVHDKIVAELSHLPHMAAYALVNSVSDSAEILRIAGTGFLDTTRIASSNPTFWATVAKQNADNIAAELEKYIENLTSFKNLIKQKEFALLQEYFEKSKQKRDSLLK